MKLRRSQYILNILIMFQNQGKMIVKNQFGLHEDVTVDGFLKNYKKIIFLNIGI